MVEETGPRASRNRLQTTTLLDAIEEVRFDAAFGGARRDEEKARAKERVFSFRDEFGQWDPRNQRPELWSLYNARVNPGEHVRVFPISNWTELDVWQYIAREKLEVPSIYFAHRRPVVRRRGLIVPVTGITPAKAGETVEELSVRFRTVGDISCTCPASRSCTAGAVPLYGMFTMSTPDCILNASPAMCSDEPTAPIAKFSSPGLDLARAISSRTSLAGTDGLATRMDGEVATQVSAVKSFTGSKGSAG